MFDLSGHVALVTGGNGGLGLAMAKGLAKAGAAIAVWGRNPRKNAQALADLKSLDADADVFECDVTNAAEVAAAFEASVERFGYIDSCFANAGGSGTSGAFHDYDEAVWRDNIDLNLTSAALTFKPMIAHLLARQAPGKLVVTSSAAALMGMPFNTTYSATKAAVIGMVRALAVEYGRAGIQANAILPGFIETDMSRQTPAVFQEACKRRSVSGKLGRLEDMEGIAVFLASRHSDLITGQAIVMDGGHTIMPM
ncbi:MAG: SDR family NAD(P)-dependent oxidoreductase [Pseudomonadota bacterium]